jgi:hypothetical protein
MPSFVTPEALERRGTTSNEHEARARESKVSCVDASARADGKDEAPVKAKPLTPKTLERWAAQLRGAAVHVDAIAAAVALRKVRQELLAGARALKSAAPR